MRIKGSVVVITGASSGVGRATALRFAGKGAHVVLAARRRPALESLAAQCREHGVEALAVPTDVTDADAVDALARTAVERFGRIDVWVNDAAVAVFSPFLTVPLADFRRVLDVNVMGCVHGARAALSQMQRQGEGVLINVASVVGEVPQPYTAAYSVSKAAVQALGVSLRSELLLDRASGVDVVTVLPATIDTPFFRHAANYTGREPVPMPPLYSPQRVARAIVKVARAPRREVVVGPAGRQFALQHKVAPGTTDAMMAVQVDRTQLSRHNAAPHTTGNLYTPSADPRDAEVEGGWHGRRRTAQRRLAVVALTVGAGLVARRALR
ncbi:SDR family oxidoreductase [Georgenia wangjunii]|uniref:SDR family oxidoreductase n=1 Tax=Georgenia wangjunii TaxID=3117730 RepID=UPI002F26B138